LESVFFGGVGKSDGDVKRTRGQRRGTVNPSRTREGSEVHFENIGKRRREKALHLQGGGTRQTLQIRGTNGETKKGMTPRNGKVLFRSGAIMGVKLKDEGERFGGKGFKRCSSSAPRSTPVIPLTLKEAPGG